MVETGKSEVPPFGERCLTLLGYGHYIGRHVSYQDAAGRQQQILAENFLDICGEHAGPPLQMLEKLGPDHPQFDRFAAAARAMLEARLGVSREQQGA